LRANTEHPSGLLVDYPHPGQPLLRLTYHRAYPDSRSDSPTVAWMSGRPPKPSEAPLRNALDDLRDCLEHIDGDLRKRSLYALEVVTSHNFTAPSAESAEGQGWLFTVNVLAVPNEVIRIQREAWNKARAE
jgi:hypothetical protein